MLIVLSNPTDLLHEHEIIERLFQNGLKSFHLRKPDKDKKELEEFLRGISPKYYRNIVIHSHYNLLEKYNLKGIHLPEQARKEDSVKSIIKAAKQRRLTVSTSMHSVADLKDSKGFDYVFISPVFNSISKKDYPSKINLKEFSDLKTESKFSAKVIGLGGVCSENIRTMLDAGFDGAAALGSIWKKEEEQALQEFIKLKSVVEEYSNV